MKTFILRLEVDETGCVVGVAERARTGEKERFHGYGMLVLLLSRMVVMDGLVPRSTHGPRDYAMAALPTNET